MTIQIGEKIRELRRRDSRTQEELANALGVTAQAVSRWESNGGYPDTELLPGIARYFGVTLDELFGYRGDREEQIDALLAKVNGMLAQNEYEDVNLSECLDLLREGLAEFPGDERILFALASALSRTGWMRHSEWLHYSEDGHIRSDFDRHRKNEYWSEAIRLFENLTITAENPETRTYSTRELIRLYRVNGENGHAVRLAEGLPPLSCAREIVLTEATDGEEQAGYLGSALLELAYEFAELLVYALVNDIRNYETEMPIGKVKGAIALFDLLGEGGELGLYHREVSYLYLYLSRLEWEYGQHDEAFRSLDNALEHARAYDRFSLSEDYRYTAPLLRYAVPKTEEFSEKGTLAANLPESWPMWCNPDYTKVKEEITADPRWGEWVRKARGEKD